MATGRIVVAVCLLFIGMLVMPAVARAQNTGIAGVVRDASGAVLPGVTVEVASPALIEKVRSVVTDGHGLYSIVDLRPGVYSVTFTLPGFTTVKRDGIALSGSFTVTANAELTVGAVEETITVTGETPNVDVRNVVQRRVLSDEVREALPTGRNTLAMSELIPGVSITASGTLSGHDVLGVAGVRGGAMIHGSRPSDFTLQLDGSPTSVGGVSFSQTWQADPAEVQEFVFELGGISAESAAGGVRTNVIPKEGGNRFTGYAFGAYTGDKLMGDNLTPALKNAGITTPNTTKALWDLNGASGGPIVRDRLWFFVSARNWGRDSVATNTYRMIDPTSFVFDPRLGAAGNADLTPTETRDRNSSWGARLTWQAAAKSKFSVYWSNQPRYYESFDPLNVASYEAASVGDFRQNRLVQATWKAPITQKFLVEVVGADTLFTGYRGPLRSLLPGALTNVQVRDLGTGYTYRNTDRRGTPRNQHDSARAAVSYITGTHAAKFGVGYEWGYTDDRNFTRADSMSFQFRNGVPIQITLFNEPSENWTTFRRLAFFAQDQWTIQQLTVNGGLRFDQHVGGVSDQQTSGPNAFAPFQRWPGFTDVPNWKDVSPRLGIAYDLFGTGKTAIKYTLGRYVVTEARTFAASMNPLQFNVSATRPWTDRNGDFIPQESELGPLSNSAFGTAQTTTQIDDAIREGWGVRQYNWETSVGVQHQLLPPLSVDVAFTRRWFRNFTVADNLALTPADYDEFCLTAPTDTRLGDVSGSRICGLYDLNPAKRTVTPNIMRTDATHYGTQTEHWEGLDVTLNARLPGRVLLQGGVNTGTEGNSTEACFVVDSPGALRFCDINRPWRSNVKLLSSVELPWAISAAVTYMRIPMPEILANYTVSSAQVGSVVQFVNPARTSFSGGSATVPLIEPGTRFQPALNQVDIRLARSFRYRGVRARFTLDIGNLLNASPVQAYNNVYGTSWLRPSYILQPRVLKPGLTFEF